MNRPDKLNALTPGVLRRALADDDVDALCTVPGIGKRTAQRLLLDLKAKLAVPDLDLVDARSTDPSAARSTRADLRDALEGLGYSPDEIRRVVHDVEPDAAPREQIARATCRESRQEHERQQGVVFRARHELALHRAERQRGVS